MKDVLIIAHFCDGIGENTNNRFNYLYKLFKTVADVEIVTSSFSHRDKQQRTDHKDENNITYIYEPSYKKNVSLLRFYSHFIMGKNLKKYLHKRKCPDIIYCAVPSLDVAYEAARYAEKNNVRFIIDVQDLWPEAFQMTFCVPVLSTLIFAPMKQKANDIYKAADEIVAVSKTYLDRAVSVNRKKIRGHCIFLGTELTYFDRSAIENKVVKPANEFWLAYIGTLGYSYNVKGVIDALKIVKNRGISNIKFLVMGDGPLKEQLKSYSQKQDVWVEFTGKLDYPEMVGLLCECDVAVNPIKGGSAGSIINKVGDYAAAGLPIINTQESPEYKSLVKEFNIGFNCEDNNPSDIAEKLITLYQADILRKTMGINNRKLAVEKFNREKTYESILSLIEDKK